MRHFLSWLCRLCSERRAHRMAYSDMHRLIGNIPTYVPGETPTAVLLVQTPHLETLRAKVIAIHDTVVAGLKLVEVQIPD